MNESLNSVDEPQSFVNESLILVNEALNSINEVKWAVIQYDPKDAINRRLYKGLILVKTAIYRVSFIASLALTEQYWAVILRGN
ncbi:hypothetical protein [Nostoc sp. TCL240-02]|uniref:hypothetical protein n=1 Tax=Nostoc sp. TCL240-02 TaxID=2572090 RepID=UPI00157F872B|nr:hypothetical protein [Nostoc sp. TCL240-02]QKQ75354.1 hypothetical protein FBB35_20480 [Nostoc sp. TCL240-02]